MASKNKPRASTGLTLSTTLFQRISDLESSAWSVFVQIYGPVVYRWCRRDGLSDDEAADVGQDVFRAVSTSIQRFERSTTSDFLSWLRTITRFKVADHFRQSAKNPQAVGGTAFLAVVTGLSDPTEEAGDFSKLSRQNELDESETHEAQQLITQGTLQLIKDRFSAQAWSAFWETAVNGRSAKDVGEDLQMSAMAVRKAKSRVLRRLKTELSEISATLFS